MPRGKYTDEQLKDFVRQHAVSGQNVKDFCELHDGLAYSTFTRAIGRHRRVAVRARAAVASAAQKLDGAAAAAPPTPARAPTATVDALRKEVKALRKMLALQWGLVKAS
jgi:hypothetical protein